MTYIQLRSGALKDCCKRYSSLSIMRPLIQYWTNIESSEKVFGNASEDEWKQQTVAVENIKK